MYISNKDIELYKKSTLNTSHTKISEKENDNISNESSNEKSILERTHTINSETKENKVEKPDKIKLIQTNTIIDYGARLHPLTTQRKHSITIPQINCCFDNAMEYIHHRISIEEAINNVVAKTKMNGGSALIYIWAIYHMYNGELYKKGVNTSALLTIIKRFKELNEPDAINNLIQSFKLHIDYLKGLDIILPMTQREIIRYEEEIEYLKSKNFTIIE